MTSSPLPAATSSTSSSRLRLRVAVVLVVVALVATHMLTVTLARRLSNQAAGIEQTVLQLTRRGDLPASDVAGLLAQSTTFAQTIARLHVVAPLVDLAATLVGLALTGGFFLASRRDERLARRRQELADERALELDAFAGRIAHDLKNPLSNVFLRLALAQRQPGAASCAPHHDAISAALDRMNRMIDGLLGFARAGAPTDRRVVTEVGRVLHDVLEDFTLEAESERIAITVEAPCASFVSCPPGALASVLGNLLRNAIKFMGDAPTEVRAIRVRVEDRRGRVDIIVEDSGPGIPAGMEEQIFEPFFRAGEHASSGLGLGLSTVRRIVDAHGGSVHARRQHHGCALVVQLPGASGA